MRIPIDTALFVGATLVVLLWGTWRARRLWRDEVDIFQGRLPLSEMRSFPTAMVGALVSVLVIFGQAMLGTDPSLDTIRIVLVGAMFVVVPSAVLLAFTTRRWGRPAALIPPHLRLDGAKVRPKSHDEPDARWPETDERPPLVAPLQIRAATLDQLVDGCRRAIECRGVVMLSVRGDERRWCAFVVSVDGSVELRVGEPPRGWRRLRPAAGERWLRDHGFVHRIDAWSMAAIRDPSPRLCAQVVASALQQGLEVHEDAELVEVLVQPGLLGSAAPPAPSAAHAEQVHHALVALARHGRGGICFEGGRPASTWAWVFSAEDGGLVLSPEPVDRVGDYSGDWTVRADRSDLLGEAYKLIAIVHAERGRSPNDPLFVSFIDT